VKTLRKLNDVMAGNASLSLLLRQAQELRGLEKILNARVGDTFTQNCKVAAYRDDGILLLIARSPVWATRLRYLVPDLLVWAKGVPEFGNIKGIHVQVERPPG
jgi:hypothetical protein